MKYVLAVVLALFCIGNADAQYRRNPYTQQQQAYLQAQRQQNAALLQQQRQYNQFILQLQRQQYQQYLRMNKELQQQQFLAWRMLNFGY